MGRTCTNCGSSDTEILSPKEERGGFEYPGKGKCHDCGEKFEY